jgi:hypothetical protein
MLSIARAGFTNTTLRSRLVGAGTNRGPKFNAR